jgi:hypothetical protein
VYALGRVFTRGRAHSGSDVADIPASGVFEENAFSSDMGSLLLDAPVRKVAAGTRALVFPLAFTLGLAAFLFLDSVKQNTSLVWTFAGAAAVLIAWNAALLASAVRRGRTLSVEIVLRKQHYLQACAQGSVLLYWGWYWREVYDWAYLIAAQLLFAYAFDMLLSWSRRDTYVLGFGPFPVIFSINLFLWFRPDWFYMQFLLVALGFAAKELIRWDKDGRRAHIFNPSSFPLAVFSIALLVTGKSDMTWGQQIASTQFYPPHMYLMLFLIGLPGQYLFGVTTMTMSAVVTTYLFGLLYYAATGIYFFYDSYIPIAVFLGMHLLFTDPSTSPRTELGRFIFGALYGLSTVALYALLGHMGMPAFYDKLLQVPVLNLSIKLIDRAARSNLLRRIDPGALARSLAPRQRHLAYMSVWAVVFAVMSAVQGVGDGHPGQWLPFWQQACAEGRPYACPYLENIVSSDCDRGSAWACEELAILQDRPDVDRPRTSAREPAIEDYPIILRGSKGPIRDTTRAGLEALACREGWPGTCSQDRR